MAFTNEEETLFQRKDDQTGSSIYAKEAKKAGESIQASIILDMVGYFTDRPFSQRYLPPMGWFYPNRGDYLMVEGNMRSKALVRKIVDSLHRSVRFPVESLVSFECLAGLDGSDEAPFWKEGFPSAGITDTYIFRDPHYHQSSDTWQTLNYGKMATAVEGLAVVITDLANQN